MAEKYKIKRLMAPQASLCLIFFDALAICSAFVTAYFTTQWVKELLNMSSIEVFNQNNALHDISFIFMSLIALFLFYIKGHYTQRVPWWNQVRYVFLCFVAAFVVDNFIRFGLRLPLSYHVMTLSWVFSFCFILIFRQIAFRLLKALRLWKVNTIIIGSINTVTDMLYAFHADDYAGYDIRAVFLRDKKDKEFDLENVPKQYADILVSRDTDNYIEYIKDNLNHTFIICLETFRGEERDALIEQLTDMKAIYSVVPPTSTMNLSEMKPQVFFGCDIMMLHAKNNIASVLGRFLKRLLDMSASGIALILLSPLFLIVGICLKAEGQGGSIFYGGYRLGYRDSKFKCWKFRSMEPDSDHLLYELLDSDPEIKKEWEKYMKLKVDDPRVTTKTAKLIRKLSIDELPQLWNVFNGDMSLVGPRPILEREKDLLGDSYKNYIKTRPGITGLWQVSGRNDTSFQRRIYMDNWYIRNWSIWGDIVILIKTLKVVFKGSGSF